MAIDTKRAPYGHRNTELTCQLNAPRIPTAAKANQFFLRNPHTLRMHSIVKFLKRFLPSSSALGRMKRLNLSKWKCSSRPKSSTKTKPIDEDMRIQKIGKPPPTLALRLRNCFISWKTSVSLNFIVGMFDILIEVVSTGGKWPAESVYVIAL